MDPKGRAFIKGAEWVPPPEQPDTAYPLFLTTGRVTYHWHTRSKTGRVPALQAAAPEPFVELHRDDAAAAGIADGDLVTVTSRRGKAQGVARLTGIEPGVAFMPFHYGDFDSPGRHGAANSLTITGWDPVSKQPHLKYAAVKVERAGGPDDAEAALEPRAARPEERQLAEARR